MSGCWGCDSAEDKVLIGENNMNLISKIVTLFKLRRGGVKTSEYNQGISYDTEFHVDGDGTIELQGKLYTRKNCRITTSGYLKIGKNCSFNIGVYLACHDEISIGNDVVIGPNVVIVDHDHKYHESPIRSSGYITGKISIGNDVWIGANSVILRGTTIGNHVVVGAGTVVSGAIEDNTVVFQERSIRIKRIEKGDKGANTI